MIYKVKMFILLSLLDLLRLTGGLLCPDTDQVDTVGWKVRNKEQCRRLCMYQRDCTGFRFRPPVFCDITLKRIGMANQDKQVHGQRGKKQTSCEINYCLDSQVCAPTIAARSHLCLQRAIPALMAQPCDTDGWHDISKLSTSSVSEHASLELNLSPQAVDQDSAVHQTTDSFDSSSEFQTEMTSQDVQLSTRSSSEQLPELNLSPEAVDQDSAVHQPADSLDSLSEIQPEMTSQDVSSVQLSTPSSSEPQSLEINLSPEAVNQDSAVHQSIGSLDYSTGIQPEMTSSTVQYSEEASWTIMQSPITYPDEISCSTPTVMPSLSSVSIPTTTNRLDIKYGYPCTSQEECVEGVTQCIDSVCRCEAGYSYSPGLDNCVVGCQEYSDNATLLSYEYCITGYNAAVHGYVSTFTACMTLCLTETSFLCKTFEIYAGHCYLSTVSKLEVPETYWNTWSGCRYYQRNCE